MSVGNLDPDLAYSCNCCGAPAETLWCQAEPCRSMQELMAGHIDRIAGRDAAWLNRAANLARRYGSDPGRIIRACIAEAQARGIALVPENLPYPQAPRQESRPQAALDIQDPPKPIKQPAKPIEEITTMPKDPTEKPCGDCGKPFLAKNANAMRCKECKNERLRQQKLDWWKRKKQPADKSDHPATPAAQETSENQPAQRACLVCGKPHSRHPTAKMCSPECARIRNEEQAKKASANRLKSKKSPPPQPPPVCQFQMRHQSTSRRRSQGNPAACSPRWSCGSAASRMRSASPRPCSKSSPRQRRAIMRSPFSRSRSSSVSRAQNERSQHDLAT